ncbi:hypothetical protein FJV46_08505 [Arthrobacter agilis]|uniref:hypothetical protein n=1 Tax=Arthrobacter agilis TaxID=37921 RepID=UPI000F6E600E|nr:hypothetical protein [Arthrobacter agilis]TPV25652.1 hypothetical protein FJV46_08505 [Arthrobacter agilis]VDR33429.1 Uncharacterised protein [Arthrobacter agilis]
MQHEDTLTAIEFAGLSVYETWMHYCNMGGRLDYLEFDAYLHGLYLLPCEESDVVSQSVNELIDDLCGADDPGMCRAPYSTNRRADTGGFVDLEPGDVAYDDGDWTLTGIGAGGMPGIDDGDWQLVCDGPGGIAGITGMPGTSGIDDGPFTVPVDDLAGPHSPATFGSRFLSGVDFSTLTGRPGVPLPPGCTLDLLGEVLDSGVIGRILSFDPR